MRGRRASVDSSSHLALWNPECIWSHPLHRRARRHPPLCIRANPPGREPPSYSAKGLCSPHWQGWAQGAQSEGVSFAPSWKRWAESPVSQIRGTIFSQLKKKKNGNLLLTYLCCLMFCMENLFAGSYSSIPKKKRNKEAFWSQVKWNQLQTSKCNKGTYISVKSL